MNSMMQWSPSGDPVVSPLAGILVTDAPALRGVHATTSDGRAWSFGDARPEANGTVTYALSIHAPAISSKVVAELTDGTLLQYDLGEVAAGQIVSIPWSSFSKWTRAERVGAGVVVAAVVGIAAWYFWPKKR